VSTVRDMVRAIRAEVRDTDDLQPERAAVLLIKLTALYGNTLDEVTKADMAYNEVLLKALNGDEAATRAKIRAQVTPEYARAREAKDTERLTLELSRSLKKFLQLKGDEMRSGI
jgi:hypothetical protein